MASSHLGERSIINLMGPQEVNRGLGLRFQGVELRKRDAKVWGYIGIAENKMETTVVHGGQISLP